MQWGKGGGEGVGQRSSNLYGMCGCENVIALRNGSGEANWKAGVKMEAWDILGTRGVDMEGGSTNRKWED